MSPIPATPPIAGALSLSVGVGLAVLASLLFQVAFTVEGLWPLVIGYLGVLFALRRLSSHRWSFYLGLLAGLGVFVPQTLFLWRIFSVAAIPLWIILALFHAAFVLVLGRVEERWGSRIALWVAPIVWCGIEYFRSEVWWLRFSWFTAGSCLPPGARGLLAPLGVYGFGTVGMAVGATLCRMVESGAVRRSGAAWMFLSGILVLGAAGWIRPDWRQGGPPSGEEVPVAGIQLEFPGVPEVRVALDGLARTHPDAQLAMLSEYTFDGEIPAPVTAWCRRHGKWLVAGGREPLPESDAARRSWWDWIPGLETLSAGGGSTDRYFNTAFVIGPGGTVVHRRAKSRPIQFFRDGEPAREQRVWDSPWGRLGILICYDASYRRVTDPLVRQGAQALLLPTMDLEAWGEHQHRLNARMARIRAAELGIPILRVASSGISQILEGNGTERATAPFPGPGRVIAGSLPMNASPRSLPIDSWLAPGCTWASGGLILMLALPKRRGRTNRPDPDAFPLSLS
ncbi:MAG: nitrilase-related carbon-nitrogen hydrolase [Verrucomicrobiota bacterium]